MAVLALAVRYVWDKNSPYRLSGSNFGISTLSGCSGLTDGALASGFRGLKAPSSTPKRMALNLNQHPEGVDKGLSLAILPDLRNPFGGWAVVPESGAGFL